MLEIGSPISLGPSGMTARGVAVLDTVSMAVKRSINLYRSYEPGWCILSVDVQANKRRNDA
jgi:hypothetical protein